MLSIRLVCACLALTLLAACDKEAPSKPKAPPAPPPLSTSPPPAPADVPAAPEPVPPVDSRPVPPPSTPAPKPVPTPPAPTRPKEQPVTAKAPLPKAKLDLRLPKDLVDQLEPGDASDVPSSQSVLPQMFAEKPAPEGPFQLNGKLITNEREDDYWRSVEGAELQFEFKR
jgi:hypothetical protein